MTADTLTEQSSASVGFRPLREADNASLFSGVEGFLGTVHRAGKFAELLTIEHQNHGGLLVRFLILAMSEQNDVIADLRIIHDTQLRVVGSDDRDGVDLYVEHFQSANFRDSAPHGTAFIYCIFYTLVYRKLRFRTERRVMR